MLAVWEIAVVILSIMDIPCNALNGFEHFCVEMSKFHVGAGCE